MNSEDFRARQARQHSTYDKTIEIILENTRKIPADADEALSEAEKRSDAFTLRERFLELAKSHCVENKYPPGSERALHVFETAEEIASQIIHSFSGLPFFIDERTKPTVFQVIDGLALRVPPNVNSLVGHVRLNGGLQGEPESLSGAIGAYVLGDFKAPDIDHLLLQALTQIEMTLYVEQMVTPDFMTGVSPLQNMKPITYGWAIGNAIVTEAMVLALAAAIAASPLLIPGLSVDWMLGITLVFTVLGTVAVLIRMVLNLTVVAKNRPRMKGSHDQAQRLLGLMDSFFVEFRGTAPFSVARFRARVDALADAGVIWPNGLKVLLDDIEARGLRSV